jgi:hypothetical protein
MEYLNNSSDNNKSIDDNINNNLSTEYYNEITIENTITIENDIHKKLDDFFQNLIWDNKNITNIENYKIVKILDHVHKLKKKLINKPKPKFSIDTFYHLEINDNKESNKEINKEINKYKKDNMSTIKIHSELFDEYHKIYYDINQFNKNKIYSHDIIHCNDLNEEIPKYFNEQDIKTTNDIIFDEYYDLFKKNIIHDDIESLMKKLVLNVNLIKILDFNQINLPIILLDCENILKSFKTHQILKKLIGLEKFNELYNSWYYGETLFLNKIKENMSMSEFSQSTKYVEPFTSINLSDLDKKYVINLIISNYLKEYFVICVMNNKNNYSNDFKQFDLDKNILFFNINYIKHEIREQDDHLILFLYFYLSNINKKVFILSGDNYKFYTEKILIYDFKFLYDFDNNKTKLILTNSSNDLIKLDKKIIPLFINNIEPIQIDNLDIINEYSKHFVISIKNNMNNELEKKIIINGNHLIEVLENIILCYDKIFDLLESKSKKDIFKLVLNKNNLFDKNFELIFDDSMIKMNMIINDYLILKFIKINYDNDKIIKMYIKIFKKIIYIYDKIDDSIDKIRKLSSSPNNYSKYFIQLNSLYLYIKKIGLFKKIF